MPEAEAEMPGEFEPDRESIERAESLTSRLIDGLRIVTEEGARPELVSEVFSQSRYAERAEGVPVADVVDSVAEMATQFATLRRWGSDVPCMRVNGEIAPISIADVSGPFGMGKYFFRWFERLGVPPPLIRDLLEEQTPGDEELVFTNVEEATKISHYNISSFLSYRFAGIKVWNGWIQDLQSFFSGPPAAAHPPGVAPGGGLLVQVSCSTPGLRIHISQLFFVSWVVFGSPSPTVTSYVLPGRYIFAGDGPMMPKRKKDRGVFRIPPTYNPVLTRF